MTKEWAKNLLTPRFGAVNTPAGVSRNVNYRCLPKPDTQGNQNLHLSDSLLVFGPGSERLTAKSYGSTPLFAAARAFSANVGSNLYRVYRGLDSLLWRRNPLVLPFRGDGLI